MSAPAPVSGKTGAGNAVEKAGTIAEIAGAAASVKAKEFPFRKADGKILKDRLVRIFKGRKGLNITTLTFGVDGIESE